MHACKFSTFGDFFIMHACIIGEMHEDYENQGQHRRQLECIEKGCVSWIHICYLRDSPKRISALNIYHFDDLKNNHCGKHPPDIS